MSSRATLRSLSRTRLLALLIAGTIAVGVAALATTFGVVHAALYRQPPFAEAGRLAMLFLQRNPRGEPPRRERWSFARFELLRQRQRSFNI